MKIVDYLGVISKVNMFLKFTAEIKYLIIVILLTLQRYFSSSLMTISPITEILQNPNKQYDFTHMLAYDSNTVIVGGTNFIHLVFARNLSIKTSRKIGPELDNPHCLGIQNENCSKSMYDSYIKVLLINKQRQPKDDELIICTSLFQGICRRRSVSTLELLSDSDRIAINPVVANNKTATTVAFLAPGPKKSTVMYVGASWTNTGLRSIRDLVPAFSIRNTIDFQIIYLGIETRSYKMVKAMYRDAFPIRYIYGFGSGNFSYMTTVQKSHVTSKEYVSKIIRVCQFDAKFRSYAETSLNCVYRRKLYNLLQTAHLSKPGRYLAKEFGIPESEDVLFGMFRYGNPDDLTSSNEESVLCIFPNNNIKQVFTRNTQKCFQGIGTTGPDHLGTYDYPCFLTRINIGDDYCGEYDINNPIDGPEPVSSTGVISLDITTSSLMVTTTSTGHNVAFVGTSSGKIKKIRIQTSSIVKEYDEVALDIGIPILKFTVVGNNQDTLYVLTPKNLINMDVENCEYKVLCEKCVADPYCKWNSESYKCAAVDNSSETISSTSQCPRITYMTKTRDNNSAIIVFGTENLSKLEGNYTCRYSGYGREITTNFKKLGNGTVQCILPQLKALPSFPGCLSMKLSIMFEESPILFDTINFFDCELETTHISCLNENCTVDGFWSSFGPFGEWSSCNQTCGGGHKNRTRYRTCTDPPPSEKGRFCEGPSIDREMQQCNEQECPVHGTWTFFQEFQDWSQCSVTCGGGTQRRVKIRTCITSKIGNETETCNGSAMEQETQSCTFSQCPSEDDGVKISILGSAGGSLLLIFCLFSIACICYRRKTIKRISQIHSSVLQSQTHLEENEDPGSSHYNYITDTIGKSEDEAEVYQEIVELDETDYLTPINATNSTNPENMDINESSLIEHSDHSSNEYYKLKTMRHDNPYSDFNHLPMDETSDDFLSNENNHDTDVH